MADRKAGRRSADRAIQAEACRWVELLSSESVDKECCAAFQAWIAADPRHGTAYIDAQRARRGPGQGPGRR